ncbi:MAG: hypothetical protein Q4G70_16260 [Pseudomonadota bacterium]|nr:hypothetical protein [Pseudomonadota bacterium]
MVYLPFAPDSGDEDDIVLLSEGRRLLWVALGAGVLLLLTFGSRSSAAMALGVAGWAASTWGGMAGISKVARAMRSTVLLKYPAMMMALVPLIGLIPVGAFLFLSRNFQAESEPLEVSDRVLQARQRAQARAARNDDGSGAPDDGGTAAARQRLARVLPKIKHANLFDVPDGRVLQAQIDDGRVALAPQPDELPLLRASGGVFGVAYVIDEGQHYAFATPAEVRQAGLSVDELHRIAVRHFTESLRDGTFQPRLIGDDRSPYRGLVMGGDFEATLVLIDRLWDEKLARYTPHGAVVAIPSRDICAFCDAGSAEGVAHLRQLLHRMRDEDRQEIGGGLLQRVNGRWVPLAG